ncbi:MAG TPA: hypothetical protein PKU69_01530 [Bacillota bacterium]|nr:hypothetical protein [Bacillota bacterium]
MKKWILGALIALAVLSIGFFAFETFAYVRNSDGNYDAPYFMPGMRGGGCFYDGDEEPNYDFLYIHLGDEDRAIIDQMYAESLSEYDFQTMTTDQQQTAISSIKTELAQYIIDNEMINDYWYGSTDTTN